MGSSSFLPSFLLPSVGKQSQLLLKPTDVEFGFQVGVEFDKNDEEVLPISQEDFKVIIGEHIVDFVTTC